MSHSSSSATAAAAYTPPSARFGRMFATSLKPANWSPVELRLLGIAMIERSDRPNADNNDIPAAYTYFGQFVDHDLTLDLVSSFERQVDPSSLRNFRTAALELDSVYGVGPRGSPYLYQGQDTGRLRQGMVMDPLPGLDGLRDLEFDVPRWDDHVPVVADARNDENLFVNQLHVALIRFHNGIYDSIKNHASDGEAFARAQQSVRLHYQHVVLRDYLPKIVGANVVTDVLNSGRRLYDPSNTAVEAFIPIEFSAAAFRFGHAMVRDEYAINRYPSDLGPAGNGKPPALISIMSEHPSFPPFDGQKQFSRSSLIGGPVRQRDVVDWSFMLGTTRGQKSRRIVPLLSDPLKKLPQAAIRDSPLIVTLASRNLLRGNTLELVEGREAARYAASVLGRNESEFVLTDDEIWPVGFERFRGREVPLWYYILQEANIKERGIKLGPLGGRIVAETIIGVLQKDPESILNANADFEPTTAFLINGEFDLAALLRAAGFKIEP